MTANSSEPGLDEAIREVERSQETGDRDAVTRAFERYSAVQKVRFAFGLINAVPREHHALTTVFGETRAAPLEVGRSAIRYVIVRRLDGEDALVAVARPARMGIAQAAVAVSALAAYADMEAILLVGIAAGQPNLRSEEDDVWLGDVVIGDRVVQYDHVKRTSAEKLIWRGDALAPPHSGLLKTAGELKGEMENPSGKWSWETLIEAAERSWSEGARPAPDADPHHTRRKYASTIHRRGPRPQLHIGAIASANMLLKDAAYRDQVHKEHRSIAFEMEGAGVALAAHELNQSYILVRGICDYADRRKNDVWQKYAALAAAAVAKALIQQH